MTQTPIYASLLVTGKSVPEVASVSRELRLDAKVAAGWPKHLEDCYRCAYGFFFNEFFHDLLKFTYVGSEQVELEELGNVWVDYLHLSNEEFGTRSVHVNMAFQDVSVDVEDSNDEAIGAVVGFLGRVYRFVEKEQAPFESLARLRKACELAPKRRFSINLSRYVNVSLPGLMEGQVNQQSLGLETNIYRLLHLHRDGVDHATAKPFIDERNWSTASFYKAYYQPGGTVTISSPYPNDEHSRHARWFYPSPGSQDAIARGEYASYDSLPEYPPLRYLAMPSVDYVGMYEETLRDVYDNLFHIDPFGIDLILRGDLSTWARRVHLARNIEAIRLPIARPLVNRLIENQLQVATIEGIQAMSERIVSRRSMCIALTALLLSVISVVIAVLQKA